MGQLMMTETLEAHIERLHQGERVLADYPICGDGCCEALYCVKCSDLGKRVGYSQECEHGIYGYVEMDCQIKSGLVR